MDTDVPKQVTPLVRRITAGNSGIFTGPGTNTYLIGNDEVTVIDPGPALPAHIEAITQTSSHIKQILLTHTHPDHSPGTKLLQDKIGVPVFALITESSKIRTQHLHQSEFLAMVRLSLVKITQLRSFIPPDMHPIIFVIY